MLFYEDANGSGQWEERSVLEETEGGRWGQVVKLSDDGKRIAIQFDEGVCIYEKNIEGSTISWALLMKQPATDPSLSMAFSGNGMVLAVGLPSEKSVDIYTNDPTGPSGNEAWLSSKIAELSAPVVFGTGVDLSYDGSKLSWCSILIG